MPRTWLGTISVLDHQAPSVLAHRCDWNGGTLLLCHNLAPAEVTVQLSLTELTGDARCVDLFDRAVGGRIRKDGAFEVELAPYRARWFRVLTGTSTELV